MAKNFSELKALFERGLRERKLFEDALEVVSVLESFEAHQSKVRNDLKEVETEFAKISENLIEAKDALKKEKDKAKDIEAKALAKASEIEAEARAKADDIVAKANAHKDNVEAVIFAKDAEYKESIKLKQENDALKAELNEEQARLDRIKSELSAILRAGDK